MTTAPFVVCYEGSYLALAPVAFFFTILYGGGVPAGVIVLLRRKRKRMAAFKVSMAGEAACRAFVARAR